MNTRYLPKSEHIKAAYEALLYRIVLMARVNLSALFTASVIRQQPDILPRDTELRLSDDFDLNLTTVVKWSDICEDVAAGRFEEMTRYSATIDLCGAYEDFVVDLAEAVGAPTTLPPAFPVVVMGKRVTVHNKVARRIRAIHTHLSLDSVWNGEHELGYCQLIYSLRNAIVHSSGLVSVDTFKNLFTIWAARMPVGSRVSLRQNDLDDFVHILLLPLTGFFKEYDEKFELK